jgi:7-keto-8-aminopelargonate synthetase-like enzyme
MSLHARWRAQLDVLRRYGRLRALQNSKGIDFTSNDYLGYATVWGADNSSPLPCSGTASRLLSGQHPIWDEVETALAGWHGAEAVLVLSSGYLANEGLLAAVIEPGDWVASDAGNHASIIEGLRLCRAERFVYRHQDLQHLEDGLRHAAASRPHGRELFVVTESLFSMEGDVTALDAVVALAEHYGAHVIVDEAHATGCFGATGAGRVDELGLRGRVLATVHTGGKALGVLGAYVCGSALLKQVLVNRCRPLLFSTALPAAVGAWWLEMVRQVPGDSRRRQLLHEHTRLFRQELARHHVAALGEHYVVPVVLGDDARATAAAEQLQQAGFDMRAVRPPTVAVGSARLRIAIHADHDPAALRSAAAAVAEAIA